MKRNWIPSSLGLISMILTCAVTAAPGPLVSVAATGGETNYDINVWLNALSPATGQKFHVSSGKTLAITPLVPKGGSHCYNMGLEVTTPGYRVTSGATGQVNGISQLPLTCTGQAAAVVISGVPTCKGEGGACRVFVSQQTTNGMMFSTGCNQGGPQTRANCICANDANKPEGATTTYRAWLSADGTRASTNVEFDIAKTYVNVANPAVIVTSPANANWPRELSNPVQSQGPPVWTGTAPDGLPVARQCFVDRDWNDNTTGKRAVAGSSAVSVEQWTTDMSDTCNLSRSLYCFEVPAA